MGFLGPTDNASSTTLFIEVSMSLGEVKETSGALSPIPLHALTIWCLDRSRNEYASLAECENSEFLCCSSDTGLSPCCSLFIGVWISSTSERLAHIM